MPESNIKQIKKAKQSKLQSKQTNKKKSLKKEITLEKKKCKRPWFHWFLLSSNPLVSRKKK